MPLRGEEFTGRTAEEAIERGLHQLGRKRSDVDIEILDRGKPANMLGLGGEDARVMLTFDETASEPEPVVDEAEVPRRPGASRGGAAQDDASRAQPEDLAAGAAILAALLEKMGVQADVEISDDPESEGLEVGGPDLDVLIGRGGENLVAVQQIVSAITSRQVGRTVHVPVDVEGFRRRREQQLREVAMRVASRVKASGQAVTLEPMLAYERRIVHLAIQDQGGIRTESVGIEPNRRIVILSTAPGSRGPMAPRPVPPGGFRPRPAPSQYGPRRDFGPRPGGIRPGPGGTGPTTDRTR